MKPPKPPAWLSRFARDEWRRVAGALARRGALTPEIEGLVCAYCSAIGTVREAEIILSKEGMTVEAQQGGVRAHPAISAKAQSSNIALQIAKRLGLFDDTTPEATDDYSELGVR
jgi:P27 family predicted phage terminase small subunit